MRSAPAAVLTTGGCQPDQVSAGGLASRWFWTARKLVTAASQLLHVTPQP